MDIYVSEFGGRAYLVFGELGALPIDEIGSVTTEDELVKLGETRPVVKVRSTNATFTLRLPDDQRALFAFLFAHVTREVR